MILTARMAQRNLRSGSVEVGDSVRLCPVDRSELADQVKSINGFNVAQRLRGVIPGSGCKRDLSGKHAVGLGMQQIE